MIDVRLQKLLKLYKYENIKSIIGLFRMLFGGIKQDYDQFLGGVNNHLPFQGEYVTKCLYRH